MRTEGVMTMGGKVFFALLAVSLVSVSALAQDEEPGPSWKGRISFPDEPFQSWTSPPFVKFTIITKEGFDPNVVYFQDSGQYEFHFDFALTWLEPFLGMTIEEFDSVTLHAANQQAVLGAVILPPWRDPPFNEYGIQLVRNDPYTREEIVKFFHLVKSCIDADPNVTAWYFPTYEQYPMAQQSREWLKDQGAPVGSTAQWVEGNTSYSEGWAAGTLKLVPGTEIQRAYTAGELRPEDILLTDGVPAEVPSVAGIITLMPSTPNSHVAILARSQGVPFVHLAVASDAARARALVGRCVYLAVTRDEYQQSSRIKLLDLDSLGATERASLLALKESRPLEIRPMMSRGVLWADTNDLQPADISFFGGKAANYGILRDVIPNSTPAALAFSFDLWNAFLDQPLVGAETTLRAALAVRLSRYATYPPADMEALSADLAAVRGLFKDPQATQFGPSGDAVLDALRTFGFDPKSNIRFRSSTNVEDSDQFTGAGLYDSFSGCLADDLDDDTSGPCACDATEKNERGVLRAIRKVFASFYNDNAFLERLKHGANEAEVGMALLVHHSFPDEIELANGVATMERARDRGWSVNVVSQKGAVSVTNPPMDAVPEEVRIEAGFRGPSPWVLRRSSLVPLREDTVLVWDAEYIELYELLIAAAERYCQVTQKDDVLLDFEFKKVAPGGRLVLKQIREIPRPGTDGYDTPLLIAGPRQYWTLQGRGGNVFTNHRVKSRWTLTPKTLWLTEETLGDCVYGDVTIEYVADGRVYSIISELPLLPDAVHTYGAPKGEAGDEGARGIASESPLPSEAGGADETLEGDADSYDMVDGWRFPDLCNPRSYRLWTTPLFQVPIPDPVVTLGDFRVALEIGYEKPVPLDEVQTTARDEVALYEPWQPTEQDVPEESLFSDPNTGVSISTWFYARWGWGWDAPTSIQFEQTRIEGLTTEPIVLTGYFSQSVGGGAHLCPKNFLFEPGLEPGIPQQTLDELRARDIRMIYYTTGARECRPTEWQDSPPVIRFYGFDEPIE